METTITEVTTLVTETVTTTVTELAVQGIDVDKLNCFVELGITAILFAFFWFVTKGLYRLLKLFF